MDATSYIMSKVCGLLYHLIRMENYTNNLHTARKDFGFQLNQSVKHQMTGCCSMKEHTQYGVDISQ